MLDSLHIENIAVIKTLDVDFCRGFTVLSGETGAGKSIIIDSLGLLLGAKADRELIRRGEERATVSAVFSDIGEDICEKIGEMGFECEDRSLMLSRVLTNTSSSARVGGRAVTLSVLREISTMLINIHGQNDNQQLLDAKNHIRLLDRFANNKEALSDYSALYREILALRMEIDSVREDSMERARLSEMLRFQIDEIDAHKLKAGEELALEETVKRLSSAEKISKTSSLVGKALRGGEKVMGAMYLVDRAANALTSVADTVCGADTLAARLENIKYELEDIAESASDICDVGEGDITSRLDKAQARLSAISRLARKYGSTAEEILAYREESAKRLSDIENADERLMELEDRRAELEKKAHVLADGIYASRTAAAGELSERVRDTLAFLDMPKVRFEVGIKKRDELSAYGTDEVEFMIATNAGAELMSMARIASGGELARIMLSLKNVLNECDGVESVIFDEVDTGISGKTARKVGIKLREIAEKSQVFCVTHSAQIASLADSHFKIFKTDKDGRACTSLELLDREGRVEEISRILGGIEITDAVRTAARELIEEA